MQGGHRTTPSGILKPTLEAIDNLRTALDSAIEEQNENAVAVLLKSIDQLATAAHVIEENSTDWPRNK